METFWIVDLLYKERTTALETLPNSAQIWQEQEISSCFVRSLRLRGGAGAGFFCYAAQPDLSCLIHPTSNLIHSSRSPATPNLQPKIAGACGHEGPHVVWAGP